MKSISKIYFRNISAFAKYSCIGIPLIIFITLYALYSYSIIAANIDFSAMITVVSFFIVTNITALMAFPKKPLSLLYNNDKTKYGDTLYDILISRYKYAMYISFYFVLIFSIIFFSIKINCNESLSIIISSLAISIFAHILIVNINMISYYFDLLEISIMQEINDENGDLND